MSNDIEILRYAIEQRLQREVNLDEAAILEARAVRAAQFSNPIIKFFTILGALLAAFSLLIFMAMLLWDKLKMEDFLFFFGLFFLGLSVLFLRAKDSIFIYTLSICSLFVGYMLMVGHLFMNDSSVGLFLLLLLCNIVLLFWKSNYVFAFVNAAFLPWTFFLLMNSMHRGDININLFIYFSPALMLSFGLLILQENASLLKSNNPLLSVYDPMLLSLVMNACIFYCIADFSLNNYIEIALLSGLPYVFIIYTLYKIFGKGDMVHSQYKVAMLIVLGFLLLFVAYYPFMSASLAILLLSYYKSKNAAWNLAVLMLLSAIIMATVRSDIPAMNRGIFLIGIGIIFLIIYTLVANKENFDKEMNKKYSLLDKDL